MPREREEFAAVTSSLITCGLTAIMAVTYRRDGVSCVSVTFSSRAWNMWNALMDYVT